MFANAIYQAPVSKLIEDTIVKGQGHLSEGGALVISTGQFTGRSPKDRYIVRDDITKEKVDWGEVNIAIEQTQFDHLLGKIKAHAEQQEEVYCRDGWAGASKKYRLGVRFFTEHPWQNLFVYNMFIGPKAAELASFTPDWEVYAFPSILADPAEDGTRQSNFSIINFTARKIIIGGTAYTGEIKKGVFSALNFILPTEYGVLPMHCSANVGQRGDTALFFGLSGTGKTTLSNDPNRRLIGDDEHGWSQESIFNFEGGCYAKVIDLSPSKEPMIYQAIRYGAMLENVKFKPDNSGQIDYHDSSITQNTRVSYPIDHIDNIMFHSRGDLPEHIFFLTCDAFGILPPISRLNHEQALYYFLLGYTAKVAGTEEGVKDPTPSFSSCFGAPFLPLAPEVYAELLGKKLKEGNLNNEAKIKVWLVNTGWTGGPFGKGSRIELTYTRALVENALGGFLDDVPYAKDPVFGLSYPTTCRDVPDALLNPRDTWPNGEEYDQKAKELASIFEKQYAPYETSV